MSYVIYDKESTYFLTDKTFATPGAAKAHMTRTEKKAVRKEEVHVIYENLEAKGLIYRDLMIEMEAAGCTKREAYNGNRSSNAGKVFNRDDYAIADLTTFRNEIEKTRTTTNILNPDSKEWEIPVNTPNCLDPGSETYHCI